MPDDGTAEARTRDLHGWTVAVTRAEASDGPLSRRLEAAGATVLHVPTVAVSPPDDSSALDEACRLLEGSADGGGYDWVVLTSARAVAPLADRLTGSVEVPVAVVGGATAAAARAAGLDVRIEGEGDGAAALARLLLAAGVGPGARVLFPGSDRARPELPEALRQAGVSVDCVVAYATRVRPLTAGERSSLRTANAVTFTSPSAVEGWVESGGEQARSPSTRLVAIGSTTAAALADRGLPAEEAEETSLDGLVAHLVRIRAEEIADG